MRSATSSAPRAPSRSRPATTPSMSAAGRFWLSLRFASTRVTASDTPDDRPEQLVDVRARRVGHGPRVLPGQLVVIGEIGHHRADPVGIVVCLEPAVHVHHLVVPRGHHLTVSSFDGYHDGVTYASLTGTINSASAGAARHSAVAARDVGPHDRERVVDEERQRRRHEPVVTAATTRCPKPARRSRSSVTASSSTAKAGGRYISPTVATERVH